METNTNTTNTDNFVPIIGIIANTDPQNLDVDMTNKCIIYEDVISFVEECGGQAIPILPWYSDEELYNLLGKVNGIISQGGLRDLDLSKPFEIFNKKILDYVVKHNSQGNNTTDNPLPIFYICQGFELLYALIYNSVDVIGNFDSYFHYIPLEFDEEKLKLTKTFSLFNSNDFEVLRKEKCTLHFHNLGLVPDVNSKNEYAPEYKENNLNLQCITIGKSKSGVEFISNAEDTRLNIFATIYHPEFTHLSYISTLGDEIFNQNTFNINEKMGKAFINLSKLSKNRFSSLDEARQYKLVENSKRLIYEKDASESFAVNYLCYFK